MSDKPIVLLDACVLYPFYLRDFLIHLSFTSRLYHPRWTYRIQEEWARHLIENVVTVDGKKISRIQKLMNIAIPDALVPEEEFKNLIPELSLPDKDDVHVLAAAIAGDVESIVTFNLKDFPSAKLKPYDLKAVSPDDLTCFLCSVDIDGVLKALLAQASIMQNPPKTPKEVLQVRRKAGLKESSELLKQFL